MRNVKGFLSDDGMFFDAKEDAELYEATYALEAVVRTIGANPEKFMIVVNGCQRQLRRYLDAQVAYEENEGRLWEDTAAPSAAHNTDGREPEAAASVLEQPTDEPKPMPDVGSGVGSEAVSREEPVDGSRGRRTHARGVLGASYMATTSPTAIAVACGSSS
jgi:hypothetical protein